MHETIIANKIIEEAKKLGNVTSLTIEVGELSELTPEEIRTTLKDRTDWKITVNYKESKVSCSCGYEGKAKILERGHGFCVYICPECNNKPEVHEGGEIKITGVETT